MAYTTNCVQSSGLKSAGIFVIFLRQDGIESDSTETELQTITFQSPFEKVTAQKPTAELWTVISNQMIKRQLPHTRLDQISDRMKSYPLSY